MMMTTETQLHELQQQVPLFLYTADEFPMRPWCQERLISEFDEETCDRPDAGA